MTVQPVEWLPTEAFTAARLSAAVGPAIESWAKCWFAQTKAAISSCTITDERPCPASTQRLTGRIVAAELSGRGKRHILEAALGVDLGEQILNEADRRLLDAFSTAIADDLVKRIEERVGEMRHGSGGCLVAIVISLLTREAVTVLCPCDALAALLKNRLGASATARRPMTSRSQAVKPSRFTAKAVLGRAELSIDELEGLAVGDVLVLDRLLSAPIELSLGDTGRTLLRGKLLRENGNICIQL